MTSHSVEAKGVTSAMRPIILDPKSPPVPRRITSRPFTPVRAPHQSTKPLRSTTAPSNPHSSTIYERAKQQLAAREAKLESLRKESTTDCTFTPTTLTSSGGRPCLPATPPRSGDSVFERLYRKGNTVTARERSVALPSGNSLQPSNHPSPSLSASCHSTSRHDMSPRLESLYEIGKVKLLQRPKSNRDEKEVRDRNFETRQLQESRLTCQSGKKRSALRMIPQPSTLVETPMSATAKRALHLRKAALRRFPNGLQTPSPRPLSPPSKSRGRIVFPSEIIVNLTGSDSPNAVVPVSCLPQRQRLKQSTLQPLWSTGSSLDPWRTPSPISRHYAASYSKTPASSKSKQLPLPLPRVWRSQSPKPWHTPLRKDYDWNPLGQQDSFVAEMATFSPRRLEEVPLEVAEEGQRMVEDGVVGATLDFDTDMEPDDASTEYGSI